MDTQDTPETVATERRCGLVGVIRALDEISRQPIEIIAQHLQEAAGVDSRIIASMIAVEYYPRSPEQFGEILHNLTSDSNPLVATAAIDELEYAVEREIISHDEAQALRG